MSRALGAPSLIAWTPPRQWSHHASRALPAGCAASCSLSCAARSTWRCRGSVLECVDAHLDLVVAITEGIPVNDMVRVKHAMQRQKHAAHRPELPRPRHARRRQAIARRLPHRHRARLHSQERQRRRRLAQRHADLRSRLAAHHARLRPEHVRRHRRRSGQRHQPPRRAQDVQRRPGDRSHHHDRRDRRRRGGKGRRVGERTCARSPSPHSSPAPPRLPAAAWATRAPSSAAAKAPPQGKIAALKAAGIAVAADASVMAETLLKHWGKASSAEPRHFLAATGIV